MGERGLAHPRHVLDQQVPPGEQAGDAVAHLGRFSDNHRVKLVQERLKFLLCIHEARRYPKLSQGERRL
jgi:hypothetical protein